SANRIRLHGAGVAPVGPDNALQLGTCQGVTGSVLPPSADLFHRSEISYDGWQGAVREAFTHKDRTRLAVTDYLPQHGDDFGQQRHVALAPRLTPPAQRGLVTNAQPSAHQFYFFDE